MTAITTTATDPGQRFASRRLYRLLSLSLSVTTLLILLAMGPVIPEQALVVGSAYSYAAVGAIGVPAVVALILFRTARIRTIRMIWRGQAIGMLLLYAAIPFVLVDGQIPAGPNSFWMIEVETIAGCAAVLAWRARTLIAYVIAVQLILFTVGIFYGAGSFAGPVAGDLARNLVTTAMFTSLAVALLRAGHLLDDTVEGTIAEAARTARDEVARAGRRTVEMLVHDRIIVALLAYASGAKPSRSAAEAHAALTSMKAETSTEVGTNDSELGPRTFAWDLQALTTQLDAQTHFRYTTEGTDPLPAIVCAALIEALSEALRNSIRHAVGDAVVSREVRATIAHDRVEVILLDDGAGFDPSSVGPSRLGITHSIVRRMENVPGGSAEVRSKVGYGTMVALRWVRG